MIKCPCCNNNIKEVGTVILDNIKCPLNKSCCFCLCELNPLENAVDNKLVSCPKCGNLFHNDCWLEYVKHKNKPIETPIINNTNNTNHFVFNPNLQIRTVGEVNHLYIGSRLLAPQPYIFYSNTYIR